MKISKLQIFLYFLLNNYIINAQINRVYSSTDNLNDIYGLNIDSVFVCGDKGIVLRTFNGGKEWVRDSLPTRQNLNSIILSNKGIGYIAGDSGTIFRSSDYGKNWIKAPFAANGSLNSLRLINDSVCFVKSNDMELYATYDSGKNWEHLFSRFELLNHLYLNNLGFVASGNKIYRTVDFGKSWDSIQFVDYVNIWNLTKESLTLNHYGELFISYDTCKSFVLHSQTFNIPYHSGHLQFIDDEFGIWAKWDLCLCGKYDPFLEIMKTYDNGKTWFYESGHLDILGKKFYFINRNDGYIIYNYGDIYKTTNGILGIYVKKVDLSNIRVKISPNPMDNYTTIEILKATGDLQLKLYNQNGQFIETIKLKEGENILYRNNKTQGIYYYIIFENNRKINSGKLIIK